MKSEKGEVKSMNCKQCAKQYMCNKEKCTGLIKFSQTKGYGIPERKEK